MPPVTRTVNPLHFEDLEPHRFEDLVRQLAYSFRAWHVLEATGRLGGDDGIDIRAIERGHTAALLDEAEEADPEFVPPLGPEREWRIQCKRERRIGPSAMARIVDSLLADDARVPYGVIVAAACDFSKKTRDEFRARMAGAGVEEFFLWGKAELEDALFRPANDHLLWAYFGVSLRVRRASQATKFRSRLATKRRLVNVMGDVGLVPNTPVLVRDPEAEEYPWPTDEAEFLQAPRWRYFQCRGHITPDHLGFVVSDHPAWWDEEKGRYDVLRDADTGWPHHPKLVGITPPDRELEDRLHRFTVVRMPEEYKARYQVIGLIHYDQVLVVDEFGDTYHEGPHLVVDFEGRTTPFRREVPVLRKYGYGGGKEVRADELATASLFPKPIPVVSDEEWHAYWEAQKE